MFLRRYFLVLFTALLLFPFTGARAQGVIKKWLHRHDNDKHVASDSTIAANYNWEGTYAFHPFGDSAVFPSFTLNIVRKGSSGYMCDLIYATREHLEYYKGIGAINKSAFKIFFSEYRFGTQDPIQKNKEMSLKFVKGRLLTYGMAVGMSPSGGQLLKKLP